jgi:hypothetical protein
MVTEDGTVTDVELLDRLTAWPPAGAAAFNVTVQMSVTVPVSVALVQLRPLSTACPVPLRVMVELVPVEELLVRVTVPLAAPATLGSKPIVRVAVLPVARVSGKLTPEMVKPPLTAPALTVTEEVPVEDSVSDSVCDDPTSAKPKLMLVALRVSTLDALSVSLCPTAADAVANAHPVRPVSIRLHRRLKKKVLLDMLEWGEQ